MSTHSFTPIHVHVKTPKGEATLDTYVGYYENALTFFAQGVERGDRTSGPMSLRKAGAVLASLGGA